MKDLTGLFNPKSVAVVGASSQEEKVGYIITDNLKKCGFKGDIYPINTKADGELLGLPAYKSVLDIPGDVDLAVMSIPAKFMNSALEECGQKGIKNVIVITAGFKEVGGEGVKLEQEMAEIANKYDMNVQGPNCLGSIDTHTPMNASFAQMMPKPGNIAFVSQSGAMTVAILDWSISEGIGFSKVVSLGNKVDISEIDVIEQLADDENTDVILCYLEGISDGERFLEVMKRVTKIKPVVILKSGSSSAGARAVSSHTGALAGNDSTFDAAFENCGVMRARSMQDLFDYGSAFSNSDLPKGKRIAVITNAGGGGVLTADKIEDIGLELADLSDETIEKLQEVIPSEGSVQNPIDVLGDAAPQRYEDTLDIVLAEDDIDSVIIMACPTASYKPHEVGEAIVQAKKKSDKPIMVVNMGGPSFVEENKVLRDNHISTFVFPETAVKALGALERYETIRSEDQESCIDKITDVDKDKAARIIADAKAKGRDALLGSEAYQVADAYGISAAPIVLATTKEEAGEAAEQMGFPVVLKIASDKILHKTDIGGVVVNVTTKEEAEQTFEKIMANAKKAHPDVVPDGVEVQKMMPNGHEVLIGMLRDDQFGPIIGFGMGGVYVNLINDVCFKLGSGISDEVIDDQINSTKISKLLKGYRGEKPSDIDSVKDTLKRVTKLTLDFPEIKELDINPVFVYEEGSSALDIKIKL
ncbi:acetate--CoA ligase family protein [Methanosphaera sp. Vir-13MRS]|jgi:acetyltransferase|uniref:acetate--CoA ligase alpha subunit n=1 Tax=Candidatus Methanosphaera massiliense TaxID=3017187 RepID=UPI002380BC28|nr:acetate--CoA ligase [Candidatus Methanosphaera massiliense]MDE4078453.1 acetate--CoA ligase family protein [Candidatus Methanosphaera massiliense]